MRIDCPCEASRQMRTFLSCDIAPRGAAKSTENTTAKQKIYECNTPIK